MIAKIYNRETTPNILSRHTKIGAEALMINRMTSQVRRDLDKNEEDFKIVRKEIL